MNRKIASFLIPSLIAFAMLAAAPVQATSFFEKALGLGKIIPPVKIHIDVWNHTDHGVKVFMDSHREEHDIAPHSKATFTANLGDFPTFHFEDTQSGLHLGSKKVSNTGNSTIEWNG